jgi:recombination DNA repair RAD52 pathway protein
MSLSEEQTEVLLRGIAPHRVKVRDGMSYVEAYDVRAMMIRVFGFAGWSFVEVSPAVCVFERPREIGASKKPGFWVAYRAHMALIVHTPDGDATYAGSAVGDAIMPDFKLADAHDMALKSAESGALKRAASNLGDGFGLSLYGDGSLDPLVKRVVGWNTKEGQPGWTRPASKPATDGRTDTADTVGATSTDT